MIDADDIVYESIDSSDTTRYEYYYGTGILAVRKEDIDTMPTIELPERKTGHWIRHIRTDLGPKLNDIIECSRCRIAFPTENMFRRSFCPNCGSYNGGDDDET